MIMGGDFNLNSSQVYTDSFKEILRQTMLNHEVTFQKQVHELHRIYITQKTLMKDCYSRELNWLQSENAASTQLNRHPFSDQLGQEPHSTEKTHSTIFLGGSTQSFQRSATQEGGDFCHRLYQRPNFSTNCMSYTDTDILVAGCNQDFIGKSNERKNCFSEDGSCCPDEVKLSLSIGGSSKKKAARRNFLTDKNRCVSSQEIIDLEEPAEMSGYDNQPGFPIHDQVTSGPRKDSQSSSKFYQKINDITVKDPADSFSTPHSGIGSNISQERYSFKIGLRDPNGKNSANVSKTIFKSKGKDKNIPCSTDLESISKLLSCDQPSNHLLNIDTRINLHCGKIRDIAKFEENVRKLNEDVNLVPSNRSQSATGDTDCCRRSSPCDFDCVVNDTLDAARTMHSGTDLERGLSSSCLIQNAESSQVAENACQLDLSSSSISKTELQVRDKMKRESTDIDTFIQEAAASLISISLESRTENHHSPAKFRSDRINGDEADRNIMRDQPESSSDSYESMVMKLTETGADDYCVSSNPFEVHELCNKDTGIKLRRGRRLKDFRKDILPGMATLSRHEIREDINIMEGVLRSREYKRLRSKAGNTGNWFTPVKSRRSRRNHGGQKNYQ
ncbi:hypothetical protein DCAR_0831669 [Daucus carota subsp. sativus]|uniref:Uncharacterized protein n=1 Tax=Daucus carota subsp. sativus TaxID=79200 RepID=A0AAF1BAE9_DAUCS|nr:hypothetical protein DCAR_0831669 [Daucus carota subsp. sativus]